MTKEFTEQQLGIINKLVRIYDWRSQKHFDYGSHVNEYIKKMTSNEIDDFRSQTAILKKEMDEADKYFQDQFEQSVYMLFPEFMKLFYSLRTECRYVIYPKRGYIMVKGNNQLITNNNDNNNGNNECK